VSYNGLDVLAALLPMPVQKQLEKYGLPLLPGAEDERGHLSEAAGDEEGEEEEEEEEGPEVPSTPPDEVLKGMLATKAEREAGERAKAEAEERAKAEEQQKRDEEAAARADWEANVKGLPKAKPESSAVQAAVLNVLRVALQNDELRAKMQQAPWPQMFLHFVHAADPEAVPIAQVEEPKASKKGAAGAKGGMCHPSAHISLCLDCPLLRAYVLVCRMDPARFAEKIIVVRSCSRREGGYCEREKQ
jgi:hypothetical protein